MKYLIRNLNLVLAMHAYVPEQTRTLTKYYRDLVNIVNEILTKSYVCINQNKL